MKQQILINHVGLLPQGAKQLVVCDPPEPTFTITRGMSGNDVVRRGELKRIKGDLGDGWVGDFSDLQEEGGYLIHCGKLVSRPMLIHQQVYDQALRVLFNYFPTQRCGDSLTGWHAPCHLDDARRADTGERVDLVGGWHQSGDLRKWLFGTPFGIVGLSRLAELKKPRWDQGQIVEELRWGNRYFHHMVRPDGGLMDHVVVPVHWGPRNVYPNDPPTCASHLVIIGQAMAARSLREIDPEHSQACLAIARRVWSYMTGPNAPAGPYRPAVFPPQHEWLSGAFDAHYRGSALECGDALYAALQLFLATGEESMLTQACSLANDLVSLQVGGNIVDNPAAASFLVGPGRKEQIAASVFGALGLVELLALQPEHPDASRWRHAVELLAAQKCAMAERNPWGLIPSYWYASQPGAIRAAGTGRYRYFYSFMSPNGGQIRVGPNHDILGAALFLLRLHRLTDDARYLTTACRQLDWVLGVNPYDASTVEGIGLNQPIRFINHGEFFPPTPQIPGAVMTGIQGDENDEPEPLANNCSTEYDMPPTAMLMWLLSELTSA